MADTHQLPAVMPSRPPADADLSLPPMAQALQKRMAQGDAGTTANILPADFVAAAQEADRFAASYKKQADLDSVLMAQILVERQRIGLDRTPMIDKIDPAARQQIIDDTLIDLTQTATENGFGEDVYAPAVQRQLRKLAADSIDAALRELDGLDFAPDLDAVIERRKGEVLAQAEAAIAADDADSYQSARKELNALLNISGEGFIRTRHAEGTQYAMLEHRAEELHAAEISKIRHAAQARLCDGIATILFDLATAFEGQLIDRFEVASKALVNSARRQSPQSARAASAAQAAALSIQPPLIAPGVNSPRLAAAIESIRASGEDGEFA